MIEPNHIGIILDGNRRWAKAKGKPSLSGHMAGYKNFYKIGRYLLLEKNIPYVSAYVFSTENWSRTKDEVGYLMSLVTRALGEYLDEFNKDGVKIVVLGSREGLDKSVLKAIEKAESTTSGNKNGTLALCFNYGGQQEIVEAAAGIAKSALKPEEFTVENFSKYLYKPEVPPLDLVIRTSGELRLSGFMLWRSAYAELYFSDKHWPDFSEIDADEALEEYARRQRRFGA